MKVFEAVMRVIDDEIERLEGFKKDKEFGRGWTSQQQGRLEGVCALRAILPIKVGKYLDQKAMKECEAVPIPEIDCEDCEDCCCSGEVYVRLPCGCCSEPEECRSCMGTGFIRSYKNPEFLDQNLNNK